MTYELYYWPGIQGRGEFVRLALEEAGAHYRDVALLPQTKGVPAILAVLAARGVFIGANQHFLRSAAAGNQSHSRLHQADVGFGCRLNFRRVQADLAAAA